MNLADEWARHDLAVLARKGLRRSMEPLAGAQGPHVVIQGERLINFSSNDYLGLAGDPRLAAAATEALARFGTGSGASRLIVGHTELHEQLERRLAAFMHTEAALLFNSGYAANVGAIPALCGPEDAIFSDALNHASLIDGCRLSRSKVVVYPHCDVSALDRMLRDTPARRRLVCTDAVFSMDGDRAPLVDLVEVCARRGAALYVDEAHAVGVIGPSGRGLAAELGIEDRIDLRMATLGKAFGVFGAFVAASNSIVELLVNRARSLVFSTGSPAAWCAATTCATDIVEHDEDRRARLWSHIRRVSNALNALGFDAQPSSAIFSAILGTPERAIDAARTLRARGLLVKPIRPPTVPAGTSRLRISLSASHESGDIEALLVGLESLPELRHAA